MNLIKHKINAIKKQSVAISGPSVAVTFALDGLTTNGSETAPLGGTYRCTLVPEEGKYLPQVIAVTGTSSAYAFMYDYTTGVISIPKGEIIGDIAISATASEVETNVPVTLTVSPMSTETYDGSTKRSETFVIFDIYPSRGSTVRVTYGGVTKTVTGDLATEQYDSVAKQVVFGTYLGTYHSAAPTNSTLTIEGAYEAYGQGEYNSYLQTSSGSKWINPKQCTNIITNIVNIGAPQYIPSYAFYACKSITLSELPRDIVSIGEYAFSNCTSITEITVPSKVSSMGTNSFGSCSGLTTVKMLPTFPPTGGNPFVYSDNIDTITVPAGCADAYKAASNWSASSDIIVEAV